MIHDILKTCYHDLDVLAALAILVAALTVYLFA
jgi:hypothetical protein